MSVYSFEAETITGQLTSLSEYAGNVLLIVNTASHCGFTPQFRGLQEMYDKYEASGLVVLGFPCAQFRNQEFADNADIAQACEMNYGVRFPMFSRIDVNGPAAHPLFDYLKREAPGVLGSQSIKWNFTKFLIGRDGKVRKRFAPYVKPEKLEAEIVSLL
jgi:glutathione peroxidase